MHGVCEHCRRAAEYSEGELQGYEQHVDDAAKHCNAVDFTFTRVHFLFYYYEVIEFREVIEVKAKCFISSIHQSRQCL